MAINLQKGQKVDLTKGNVGLNELLIGLGWDAAKGGGGVFGFLGGSSTIDIDASAVMLGADGRFRSDKDIIYYHNLQSRCGSVRHTGDNLTGDGDGDDEQIIVNLGQVPENIQKIVFFVNIYDCKRKKQDFGFVKNAFIRVANNKTGEEVCRYNLTEDYAGKTAVIVGEVYRHNGEWKFAAIGEGTTDGSISEVVRRYK